MNEAMMIVLGLGAPSCGLAFNITVWLIGKDLGKPVRWYMVGGLTPFRLAKEYEARFPKGQKTLWLRVFFYASMACLLSFLLLLTRPWR